MRERKRPMVELGVSTLDGIVLPCTGGGGVVTEALAHAGLLR